MRRPAPLYERFDSLREYERMMDEFIAGAQHAIRIFEESLSSAYDTRERDERLRGFLRTSATNSLRLVVHDPGPMERRCPRFVALRQQFSERIEIRVTPRWARHVHDPFAVFDARHYLHRFHYDRMRAARGMHDPSGAQQLLDRFGELWDASTPARSASVMGL